MLPRAQLLPANLRSTGVAHFTSGQSASAAPTFTLPPIGSCSGERTLTIGIFDDSPSVAGLGGNDPISRRYEEAQIALRHVAAACSCKKECGAVLHFDQPSPWDIGPNRLHGRGLRRLSQGLQEPSGGYGSSCLLPSLRTAVSMATHFKGDAVQLIVFSDFLLTDAEPDAALTELAEFPGAVHAVVMTTLPPVQLETELNVTVTVIDGSSEPGAVASALVRSLCESRIGTATG